MRILSSVPLSSKTVTVVLLLGGAPSLALVACNEGTPADGGAGGIQSASGGRSQDGGSSSVMTGGGGGSGGIDPVGGQGGERPSPSLCFDSEELPSCASLTGWATLIPSEATPVELVEARDFGENARFVMLGGDAALLEIPEASGDAKYKVSLADPYAWGDQESVIQFAVSWPEAQGDWSIRAVGTPHAAHANVVALACDSETCLRLGANRNDSTLRPLDEPPLPLGRDADSITERLDCVYGSQAYCLEDGAWRELPVLPVSAGTRFELLASVYGIEGDRDRNVAVTDRGTVLIEMEDAWESMGSPPDGAVRVASIQRQSLAILYEDGTWYEAALLDSNRTCEQKSELMFAAPIDAEMGSYLALGQDGQTYLRPAVLTSADPIEYTPTWCKHSPERLDGLIAATVWPCGASVNFYAISDTTFWSLFAAPVCALT